LVNNSSLKTVCIVPPPDLNRRTSRLFQSFLPFEFDERYQGGLAGRLQTAAKGVCWSSNRKLVSQEIDTKLRHLTPTLIGCRDAKANVGIDSVAHAVGCGGSGAEEQRSRQYEE
jgi:hypothetical protein